VTSDVPQVLGGTLLVLLIALVWWWLPKRQIGSQRAKPEAKELFEAENDARATLGHFLGGLAILGGLFFSWWQIQDTQRLTEQGQITDRFTHAVDQLGAPERQVRLGGIYALERIARDSKDDVGPVMEILTAFVRERAPWPSPSTETPQVTAGSVPLTIPLALPADVQAVLTVIDRGSWSEWWPGEDEETPGPGGLPCLNLADADLRGARLGGNDLPPLCMIGTNLADAYLTDSDLEHAYLAYANLAGAHLGNANLADAYLVNADLAGADLRDANLLNAYLAGANLRDVNLRDANLANAYLGDADLTGVDLTGAHLEGANLEGAINLTQGQLSSVATDARTRLPPGLHPPARSSQGAPTGSPSPT
jgi:hypothetical protein